MATPNLLNLTTITGNTDLLSVTTVSSNITVNAAASNKIYKINSIIVSNIDGANTADITVDLYRSGANYSIAKGITVPADTTLVVVSKDMSVYLREDDRIQCYASANGDLQAICTYEALG